MKNIKISARENVDLKTVKAIRKAIEEKRL